MDKKLPKVFANKIDKPLNNNESVYYEKKDGKEEVKNEDRSLNNNSYLTINQKINKIFGSSRYVYKADVIITTKDGKLSKKVIGRNKNELITMDNELIKVSDIIDIEFSES